MTLNFPDSPTLNQEVELGGKTYRWDGVKWRMVYVVTPTAQSLAPTITEVSVTLDSITFTITNNDTDSAVILYEVGDNTPDENGIELAASATSSNITVTGLSQGTEYTVSATASVTGKVLSNVTSLGITTDQINYTNATGGSALVNYNFTYSPQGTNWYDTLGNLNTTGNHFSTNRVLIQNDSIILSEGVFAIQFWDSNLNYLGHYTNYNLGAWETNNDLGPLDFNNIIIPNNAVYFNLNGHPTISGTTGIVFHNTLTEFQSVIASYVSNASGVGVVEYDEGGKRYRSHTFVSSGTFVVTQVGDADGDRNKVDYLIIAGGGAGGYEGAGGAGGYRTTNGTSGGGSSAESKVTVTAQSYSIVVGAGGAGGVTSPNPGNNGVNSSAFGITAIGGGGGGFNRGIPASGGSGGGGGAVASGGAGTSGQGFSGGAGSSNGGGGGGGAGSVGTAGQTSGNGQGGSGLANTLRTGSAESRGGGGGGGVSAGYPQALGQDGGGNGNSSGNADSQPGTLNTGGGAGGDWNSTNTKNGGSGIVIIRYEIAPSV